MHALFDPTTSRTDELCEVDFALGEAFAVAARGAIDLAGVRPDLIARFTRRLPVDGNQTGHDSAPGLFPAFAQTAFHESLVETGHVE